MRFADQDLRPAAGRAAVTRGLGAAQRLERCLLQFHGLDAELHHVEAHLQPAFDDPQFADLAVELGGVERGEHRRRVRKRQAAGRAGEGGTQARRHRRGPRHAESRNRNSQRIPHLLHELRDVLERARLPSSFFPSAMPHLLSTPPVAPRRHSARGRVVAGLRQSYRVCRAQRIAPCWPASCFSVVSRSRNLRDRGIFTAAFGTFLPFHVHLSPDGPGSAQ